MRSAHFNRYPFTLIELMIVMVILLSMGTVLSINIAGAVKQQRFRSASQEILNKLQMAQELMIMRKQTIYVDLRMIADPTPHFECIVDMNPGATDIVKDPMQKVLDTTKSISGIGDMTFTDSSGTLHRDSVRLKFISMGNHVTKGVLRLYSDSAHRDLYKSIVLYEYPHRLELIDGEPTIQRLNGPQTISSNSVFPIEVYETLKKK